jgi:hypothetical protein
LKCAREPGRDRSHRELERFGDLCLRVVQPIAEGDNRPPFGLEGRHGGEQLMITKVLREQVAHRPVIFFKRDETPLATDQVERLVYNNPVQPGRKRAAPGY